MMIATMWHLTAAAATTPWPVGPKLECHLAGVLGNVQHAREEAAPWPPASAPPPGQRSTRVIHLPTGPVTAQGN